ncbi:MAG TPA: Gfo/Idh/MocA family oxidoreductase [Bryobacteraceae bacterium]|jgi:predicted dehydrogenase|nr:Gfo/Idh/MocA family oxidoreductase [Bryobacteraceae bacterium]
MQTHTARRQFVQAAAAAIATARFPILGANDRVNVGIVGLGGRGTDHIRYYSKLPADCRIAALCDVNQAARERAQALVRKLNNYDAKEYSDMRSMFESKDVDAVSLPLPNHWHALATIWACQAGKDVYVEKPASHNIFEGRQMVKAARKYNRMVQVGSQSRSIPYKMRAIQLLREGAIGQIYHARGECFRRRFSIGHTPDEPPPPGLNWDEFLGPAQWKPYSKNKYAYNWHWFWDTGNGDIGNQGVHEMDIALWGLGRTAWPASVSSTGGKYVWKDDQETPNTQQTTFEFGDAQITFEVRNLPTPPEGGLVVRGPNYVGNIFFGSSGFLVVDHTGFQLYKSTAGDISGEAARGAGAGSRERYEKTMDEKPTGEDTVPHMKNFLDAIRARDYKKLNADVEIGTHSAAFCHLANIAYRTGRLLRMNDSNGRFLGDDEANSMLTRNYRAPYVVPENV